MAKPLKVFVAEDHAGILAHILEALNNLGCVTANYTSAQMSSDQAVQACLKFDPDVAIFDLSWKGTEDNGMLAAQKLNDVAPGKYQVFVISLGVHESKIEIHDVEARKFLARFIRKEDLLANMEDFIFPDPDTTG